MFKSTEVVRYYDLYNDLLVGVLLLLRLLPAEGVEHVEEHHRHVDEDDQREQRV